PSKVAIANGMALWVDPSEGQIGRASLSSGLLLSPLQVSSIPAQLSETQPATPEAPQMLDAVAAYDAGAASKVFFHVYGWQISKIQSCNTDGTGLATVIAAGTPGSTNTTALAVDSVNQNLYWAQTGAGNSYINKSDLSGGSVQTIVTNGQY